MLGVPWTKFQDFYLRLGFLKVLVATLSPHRRSATNDSIYQKVETPLFRPLQQYPDLYDAVSDRLEPLDKKRMARGRPYLLEALLIKDACPSWVFAVTSDTIYKVLDWAHDVQLVGAGNQISERGLSLRGLLPSEATEFLSGAVKKWNPFKLTLIERLFFLFHLIEIDRVTLILTDLLARDSSTVLESSDAGKLTCKAMFAVLDEAQQHLSPSQLPKFRVAYDLARVIAQELEMSEYLPSSGRFPFPARRLPKPPKIIRRPLAGFQANSSTRRKPNKNADHQTIPRFEQLIDLGFISKPSEDADLSAAPQRRWRYIPTDLCRRWVAVRQSTQKSGKNWLWNGFARAAVEAFLPETDRKTVVSYQDRIRFFARGYDAVRRPVGHTPLDSVALRAMLDAAAEGLIVEMESYHDLMLTIKTRNLLPDHAFFAAGNELDKMFINLRPGFEQKLLEIVSLVDDRSIA